ncbi:PhzF family phenazine biosynthesis protein [Photobacterium minamisatsumaniensis]|uniref:PhzF family phenazine biosynthesis protein n=1 Tax=Photobacterium minamisatsumaniensis TaxID=2910233 RepID=UPI003D0F8B0D
MNAYIFNVFTGKKAKGNPAAVVKLNSWLPAYELKAISRNLGQPVTSFIVDVEQGYEIRWFAGEMEINLCGHGSLAAAATIFKINPSHDPAVELLNKHGTVSVNKCANGYTMAMPSWDSECTSELSKYSKLLDLEAIDVFATRDLVVVLESEEQVRNFKADFDVIKNISEYHAVILTAQKGTSGYVLRYFAPSIGINEDIATGSAQCSLVPYWSNRLSLKKLEVNQLSAQGGYFQVNQNQSDTIELTVSVVLTQVVKLGEKQEI